MVYEVLKLFGDRWTFHVKKSIFKSEAKWNVIFSLSLPLIGIGLLAVTFVIRWLTR